MEDTQLVDTVMDLAQRNFNATTIQLQFQIKRHKKVDTQPLVKVKKERHQIPLQEVEVEVAGKEECHLESRVVDSVIAFINQ